MKKENWLAIGHFPNLINSSLTFLGNEWEKNEMHSVNSETERPLVATYSFFLRLYLLHLILSDAEQLILLIS